MMSLAADIGGTFSRLAWTQEGSPSGDEQRLVNAEFDSIEAMIDHGLALRGGGQRIDRMVLALPGPVYADPVRLTNIDWQVHRHQLQRRYHTDRLLVVNDFQAAALGAISQPHAHLKILNPVTPDDGAVVVAGAGTGLGMAWLPSTDLGDLPRATEGGHLDFAPTDTRQLALHRWLADRYGHVSYERVVSGDGLLDTYRFIAGSATRADDPAGIVALAAHDDTSAREAVQLFVAVFAAYAGNLALAFNPTGGIYLCGGLTAHLADWFDPIDFMLTFSAKGRMAEVVRRVPVFLVTHHDTGLTGAKHLLRRIDGAKT